MQKEKQREETIIFQDEHTVGIITTIPHIRTDSAFTFSDLSGKVDDQLQKDIGKMTATAIAFEDAFIAGLNQISLGFNHTNALEMLGGAGIVILASSLIPTSWNYLNEAKQTRREKKKIDQKIKSES